MNKGRILIVDDEDIVLQNLSDYFVNIGFDVATAHDGEEALKTYVPGVFDCVIADLLMPRMDGIALLEAVKRRDDKVIFIMITGYPSVDSAVDAMKIGAFDYVIKPFKMEDIQIKIERALNTRKAEESLRKMTGLMWGLILSIPLWLILGIILGIVWK